VKLFSSKRRNVATAAVVVLVLFLLHPGASRLKTRITNSISRAVERPADIGSVHLRFLPRPGFDLENVVIYEDPAFGNEPMLRAPEVTAVVRLTSLLRGRLDIARLELTEPSLNLVRRQDGRWNWESLLEHAARTPLAPTAKPKLEPRRGFPYIEASSGRINFKTGLEKMPYALLNADFSLWQESENTWGVRLKAEPLRTDTSLSDTGLIRVNGAWQRAASLRQTPLQFSIEWERGQLGQLTKLVSGSDKGWRGEVRLDATLNGTPAALLVTADAAIEDFRRYDLSSSDQLRLGAHCDARYSSVEAMMHEIFCSAPVGNGMITLHGDAGLPGAQNTNLALNLESVPVSAVAQLARRVKQNLPSDLISIGSVQGNFELRRTSADEQQSPIQGRGEITNLRLQSASTKVAFAPGTVPFALNTRPDAGALPETGSARVLPFSNKLHVEIGPFPIGLGRPAPAQARARVSRSGYEVIIRGEGEVSRTLGMASLLGLPALKATAEGTAQMDLQIAGSWRANPSAVDSIPTGPHVTGTVQLRNVHATVRGVNATIEIPSAELQLLPDEARVEKLKARAADSLWTGSVTLPRGCGTPGACLVRFNLNTGDVGLGNLANWLRSKPNPRRWYQILGYSAVSAPTLLDNLHASGNVTAHRLLLHDLIATRVSASLQLQQGKLKISELRADLLGGKHVGDWQADFTAAVPTYTGSGTLTGISLPEMAEAMHGSWISGTGGASYQFTASGADSAAFWQSAEGTLRFDLQDAVLPHIVLAGDDSPLQVTDWQGRARLRNREIEIDNGKLVSPPGTYEIGGTASFSRVLDLKLVREEGVKPASVGSLVYAITGTLEQPQIALIPTPQTQAQLKP
jgi:AsmA family/AsmA-like C-terminal region